MADLYPDWMGPQGEGNGTGKTIHSTAGDTTIIEYVDVPRKKPRVHMKVIGDDYKYNKKPKVLLKIRTKDDRD